MKSQQSNKYNERMIACGALGGHSFMGIGSIVFSYLSVDETKTEHWNSGNGKGDECDINLARNFPPWLCDSLSLLRGPLGRP